MYRLLTSAMLLILASSATAAPVNLHDDSGEKVLNGILTDHAFWADAASSEHDGQVYDQIRLKKTDGGYVPMITGEGGQDYDNDVISDVVFYQNTHLPGHMDGAKAIVDLGSGYDQVVGAPYRDTFYVLDMTVMYVVFPQRMYRQYDEDLGQTVLSFEKIEPGFVDSETWARYESKMKSTTDGMSRRVLMNGVVEADEVFGMFVVEPGRDYESRVTFVSKIGFGETGGWMAKLGSRLPPVLKSGLKSGFDASVSIAAQEQKRRG